VKAFRAALNADVVGVKEGGEVGLLLLNLFLELLGAVRGNEDGMTPLLLLLLLDFVVVLLLLPDGALVVSESGSMVCFEMLVPLRDCRLTRFRK